ncbi:MAG: Response regulator of zinc sigma-54-dependent two-component system [Polyangiaceae bacterium]|nr:Response regulator of zinc sigma-54-dependent two-component system [Polyangiaceae bacterium]
MYTRVSRFHLRLHVNDRFVEAEDLGSANGSSVLRDADAGAEETSAETQQRLAPNVPMRLEPGDVLRVGGVPMVLQARRPSTLGTIKLVSAHKGGPILLDPEMKRAYDLAARTAQSDIAVLILGETGVGKEVMAESIHRKSHRNAAPFLKLNCAALPEALLESELFGHERGAFTGAHAAKIGLLESTDGGTVFLDELGELPLGTQAKLLRVLEERIVLRLGSNKPREINVRFVTATNRDLYKEARAGRFREDLYYRVSGMILRIPPLRERRSEIEPLARHFLRVFCTKTNLPEPELSESATQALVGYSWPGNVRELRNVTERAALLADGHTIDREHILLEPDPDMPPAESTTPASFVDELEQPTGVFNLPTPPHVPNIEQPLPTSPDEREHEKQRVIRALDACGGNQTRAAEILQVSRRTLINRMIEFGLPRPRKN